MQPIYKKNAQNDVILKLMVCLKLNEVRVKISLSSMDVNRSVTGGIKTFNVLKMKPHF
jgi:hypothetical protein